MKRITFVCLGNICRSPAAEYIFKHIIKQLNKENEYEVISRATSYEEVGNDIYPPMKRTLNSLGVSLNTHHATRFSKDDYENSDYITIHVPLTDDTKDYIGKAQFEMMKPGVYLINYARGPVINNEAVVDALKSGKVHRTHFDSAATQHDAAIKSEDSYGYKIIKDMKPYVEISESTLYPILRRLETADLLTVYTVERNGRLRKYYHITELGRKRIGDFQEEWKEIQAIYQFVCREESGVWQKKDF